MPAISVALAVGVASFACSSGGGSSAAGADAGGELSDAAGKLDAAHTPDAGADGSVDASAGEASACTLKATDAGATCNDIAPSGPMVATTCASGEPPEGQGGSIEDGSYVLESSTWYGACQAVTNSAVTWNLCGTDWEVAETQFLDAGTSTLHVDYVATVGSTTVAIRPVCETLVGVASMTRGYSASPGHFMFVTDYTFANGNAVLVDAFVRQ
jgi:hypothetical protein